MDVRTAIFALIVSQCAITQAFSEEIFTLFESVRAKSMGGAQLTVSDDELGIYANPASLAKVRNPRFSFDTATEVSTSVISPLWNVLSNIASSGAEKNPLNAVSNTFGKYHYFSFATTPHFVARNFAIHGLFRHQTGFFQSDANTLEMRRRIDSGIVAGMGLPLFGGVMKLGASGKMIHRADANTLTTNGTTFSSYSFGNNLREGLGFGFDAGAQLTIPIRFFPAFAGVVRNIGGMKFGTSASFWSDSSGTRPRPETERQTIDVAYGMTFRMGRDSWVNMGVDLRDIMGFMDDKGSASLDKALYRHLHAGIEFSFDRLFFIRAGAYQSYPSVGIALVTRVFALEAAFYGIETGTLTERRASWRGVLRLEFGY